MMQNNAHKFTDKICLCVRVNEVCFVSECRHILDAFMNINVLYISNQCRLDFMIFGSFVTECIRVSYWVNTGN